MTKWSFKQHTNKLSNRQTNIQPNQPNNNFLFWLSDKLTDQTTEQRNQTKNRRQSDLPYHYIVNKIPFQTTNQTKNGLNNGTNKQATNQTNKERVWFSNDFPIAIDQTNDRTIYQLIKRPNIHISVPPFQLFHQTNKPIKWATNRTTYQLIKQPNICTSVPPFRPFHQMNKLIEQAINWMMYQLNKYQTKNCRQFAIWRHQTGQRKQSSPARQQAMNRQNQPESRKTT